MNRVCKIIVTQFQCFNVRTVHLVQFIIQTNKCTIYIYINNILYIISTSICFNTSAKYKFKN